jgi:hypothetical protein
MSKFPKTPRKETNRYIHADHLGYDTKTGKFFGTFNAVKMLNELLAERDALAKHLGGGNHE